MVSSATVCLLLRARFCQRPPITADVALREYAHILIYIYIYIHTCVDGESTGLFMLVAFAVDHSGRRHMGKVNGSMGGLFLDEAE